MRVLNEGITITIVIIVVFYFLVKSGFNVLLHLPISDIRWLCSLI